MRKKIFIFILFLISTFFAIEGESNQLSLNEDKWNKLQKEMAGSWKKMTQEMNTRWDNYEKEQEKKWAEFKRSVEKKWARFEGSTKKNWVEYSDDKETKSRVDFKKGSVVLETVVPVGEPATKEKAKANIREQIEKVFQEKDYTGKAILDNQLEDDAGRKVTSKNIMPYIKKEVLPNVKPESNPYRANDGLKRQKYKVELQMVSGHTKRLAEKYIPFVRTNAERFNLKPNLIMAIIHTESYFNPKAVSSCRALGLMQIIPKYAGREAYASIYGQEKLLTEKYLFDPEKNIQLGCCYFSLLRYNHFKDVPGEIKNRYVSICGYNWGPSAMRRKIVNRYNITSMSEDQLFQLLRVKTPQETRGYIKKVTERAPLYKSFF